MKHVPTKTRVGHGLFNKASFHFKAKQWRLAVDSYHKLFKSQPQYLTICMNEYWTAIANCIHVLTKPYATMEKKMCHHHLNDRCCSMMDATVNPIYFRKNHKSKYKLIKKYYKARVNFIQQLKKYNINNYDGHSGRAISEYLSFLKVFSNNYRLMFKYMCKMQICHNGQLFNILHYIYDLYFLIRTGQFSLAYKLIQSVRRCLEFDDICETVYTFLYCYMLQRLSKYAECLQIWSGVEKGFNYKTIDLMLFPSEPLAKESCSRIYPRGIREAGIYMPNTAVFDFKLKCYIGLKQYRNARKLTVFYYDLWGKEDQTVFYDGYLDLRMGNISAAQTKLRYIPATAPRGFGWKQNQHYFAGLMYYALKEYDHAKYHLVCAEYSQVFGVYVAEHFYWLSRTLIKCKEWKLAKRFLQKAKKLTPEIECIKVEYDSTMELLDSKLSELRCANIKCLSKEKDIETGVCNLKVCKGCGKSVYCSRHCQKVHWKAHRVECDRSWIYLFKMMNTYKYINCAYGNHLV